MIKFTERNLFTAGSTGRDGNDGRVVRLQTDELSEVTTPVLGQPIFRRPASPAIVANRKWSSCVVEDYVQLIGRSV